MRWPWSRKVSVPKRPALPDLAADSDRAYLELMEALQKLRAELDRRHY